MGHFCQVNCTRTFIIYIDPSIGIWFILQLDSTVTDRNQLNGMR